MRRLHVLMPMTDRDLRFASTGITTPKPLISINGVPMFLKAFSSFFPVMTELTLTCIAPHDDQTLRDGIEAARPGTNVVDAGTGNFASDVLAATTSIDEGDAIAVMSSEFWFHSYMYMQLIEGSLAGRTLFDLALLTSPLAFSAVGVETNSDGVATRFARRRGTRDGQAVVGPQFFADKAVCVEAFENSGSGTIDLPSIYNKLLASGRRIVTAKVESSASFTRFEEINSYIESTVALH